MAENETIVAFQGIHGAYSELALKEHFGPDVVTQPFSTFFEIFKAIESRTVDYGILPVENAFAGAVSQSYELLLDHDLRIQAEVILHVKHALMAPRGTTIDDLHSVWSHPQALAQTEQFLRRNGLKAIPTYDTAGSAKMLSEQMPKGIGAIASTLSAELYNLEILVSGIEDVPFNFTRFLLLGHEDPSPGEYNKTSLVFATRNQPAALYESLGEFAKRGLNLTKLESRPRKNQPWVPVFYLDVEGHWQDEPLKEALVRLLQHASFVKMLGSYPAVKTRSVGI